MKWIGDPEAESQEALSETMLYRTVLIDDPKGRELFALILADLGHFELAENDHQRVLKNYATRLLEKTGVYHETNVIDILEGYANTMQYFPGKIPDEE